jgi:hypothetical protein
MGFDTQKTLGCMKDKIRLDQTDSVIGAQLPGHWHDPRLFVITVTSMIHGPCKNVSPNTTCMKDGKGTKNIQ